MTLDLAFPPKPAFQFLLFLYAILNNPKIEITQKSHSGKQKLPFFFFFDNFCLPPGSSSQFCIGCQSQCCHSRSSVLSHTHSSNLSDTALMLCLFWSMIHRLQKGLQRTSWLWAVCRFHRIFKAKNLNPFCCNHLLHNGVFSLRSAWSCELHSWGCALELNLGWEEMTLLNCLTRISKETQEEGWGVTSGSKLLVKGWIAVEVGCPIFLSG